MASKQFYDLVITELTIVKLIRQLDEICKVKDSTYDIKGLVEFLTNDLALGTDIEIDRVQLDETLQKLKFERMSVNDSDPYLPETRKKAFEAFTSSQAKVYEEHRRVWWEYIFGLEEEINELNQKLERLKEAQKGA